MLTSLFLLSPFLLIISLASTAYDRYLSFHWKGALTSNSIIIKAFPRPTLFHDDLNILFVYYEKPLSTFNSSRMLSITPSVDPYPVVAISLQGLSPETTYYYSFIFYQGAGLTTNEVLSFYQTSQWIEFEFKTLGIALLPHNFTFGAASCAKTGSESKVFTLAANAGIDFFIHMGDLHYEDIQFDDEVLFFGAYSEIFGSSTQNYFFSKIPIFYIWDDHDFGQNNADGNSDSKPAVTAAYEKYVPHGPLKNPFPIDDSMTIPGSPQGNTTASNYTTGYQANITYGIYRSFIVGRCLFIILDLRTWKDIAYRDMLGSEQLTWLENQLKYAGLNDNIALVVLVSTLEWISNKEFNWGYYPSQQTIGDWIQTYVKSQNKELVILAGDSHMIAFDDGTNNRAGKTMVIQAAALDRRGSCKGGPYSHGIDMGAGHFGVMSVLDYGDKICLKVSLRDMGDELIAYDTCNKALYPAISGSDSCFAAYVRYYKWLIILASVFLFLLFAGIGLLIWKRNKKRKAKQSVVDDEAKEGTTYRGDKLKEDA